MSPEDKIVAQYCATFGACPRATVKLPGAGSGRLYFRLTAPESAEILDIPESVIGTIGMVKEENRAFVTLARHFRSNDVRVPEIYAVDDEWSCYLQQDLGNWQLFEAIDSGRTTGSFSDKEIELLSRSMELLAAVQYRGAKELDFSICYPDATMNRRMIDWDLQYFKYCFLKPSGIDIPENALQDDFDRLGEMVEALAKNADTFMVRDFQSRNVMIDGVGRPWLIDFQGGRRGPAEYDVASFLWQAKARIPDSLKTRLIDVYIQAVERYDASFDGERFRRDLPLFVLLRLLQVLGAYGFRGWQEGKAHFLQSIPAALESLDSLLEGKFGDDYPAIRVCVREVQKLGKIRRLVRETELPPYDGLTVKVFSFSYKKGLPPDLSGNGGGFVFDCRAVHNPGRYERYKSLTGRDDEVKRFLEDDGEILTFLEHCRALVSVSVERYLRRGFSSLSVGFGCTGGQHRSVYSAESLAHELKRAYPQIRVLLVHDVQNITEVL